jgi:hypothetical protein
MVPYLRPARPFRPQRLALTAFIMHYHGIRRIQYNIRRTVVLLQLYRHRVTEILFKIQYVADIRPAPAVYALVVVTHHAYVAVFRA